MVVAGKSLARVGARTTDPARGSVRVILKMGLERRIDPSRS
jgi:hypothetical protein